MSLKSFLLLKNYFFFFLQFKYSNNNKIYTLLEYYSIIESRMLLLLCLTSLLQSERAERDGIERCDPHKWRETESNFGDEWTVYLSPAVIYIRAWMSNTSRLCGKVATCVLDCARLWWFIAYLREYLLVCVCTYIYTRVCATVHCSISKAILQKLGEYGGGGGIGLCYQLNWFAFSPRIVTSVFDKK